MKKTYGGMLVLLMLLIPMVVTGKTIDLDALLAQGTEVLFDDFELDWVGDIPLMWRNAGSKLPFVVAEIPEISPGQILHFEMDLSDTTSSDIRLVSPSIPLDCRELIIDFEYYQTPIEAYVNLAPEVRSKLRVQFNLELSGGTWPPRVSVGFDSGRIYNIGGSGGTFFDRVPAGCWQRATIILDLQEETVSLVLNGELSDYVGQFRTPLSGLKEGTIQIYWAERFTDWYLRYVRVVAVK